MECPLRMKDEKIAAVERRLDDMRGCLREIVAAWDEIPTGDTSPRERMRRLLVRASPVINRARELLAEQPGDVCAMCSRTRAWHDTHRPRHQFSGRRRGEK